MSDPPRLLDTLGQGSALRDALEAGRAESPSPAQLAALAAKLGPIIGAGIAGGGAGGAAAAASGAGGAAAKAGAGAAGVAGAGAAKVVGAGAAAKIIAVVATSTALVVGGTVAVQRSSAPAPSAAQTTRGLVATSTVTATSTPTAISIPAPVETAISIPSATATPAATHAPPPLTEDEETQMLEDAQDALRADPARALSLANQHAQRAPRGNLAQEREVIAIEALVKLGRAAEAKQRAARFAAAYPRSAQLRRVQQLVGEGTP
jgi:hypothetical protein